MNLFFKLSKNLFLASGITLFILFILEDLRPGFVTLWVRLDIFLYLVLISGGITFFTSKNFKK